MRIFDPKQLELILSGTLNIDIEDWRENTEYKGGYFDGHVVSNVELFRILIFIWEKEAVIKSHLKKKFFFNTILKLLGY